MKARRRKIALVIAAGRAQCSACKRGYRFRTIRKNADGSREIACRYCEMLARPAPRADFRAFMGGIRDRVLAAGVFRNVIAFNRRWNVRFSRADGWKPTPPTARAA